MTISDAQLFDNAKAVREFAHAPYSKFKVGAAIIDESGRIHVGCNVENAAYPLGACAEASAIGAMVSQGGKRIVRIAILGGGHKIEPCTPCGGCRQTILEFADDQTRILLMNEKLKIASLTVAEILPMPFRFTLK
ncbi:MAG: cytidine deaminase [Parvularculaceae bacterium]